ncbi:MAG: SOS response-associated peptidase [Bacteroidales bacterium]
MCFTVEIHTNRKAIEKRFAVDGAALAEFDFHYFYRAFAFPLLPVITQEEPDRIVLMEWGLIPSWARDRDHADLIRKGTFNARSETLEEKSSFRKPLESGRCQVIVHGFFEWQHAQGGKFPWYIRLRNDELFAMAGLFDRWHDAAQGRVVETFTILTTTANTLMAGIHNTKERMPVILPREKEGLWLAEGGRQEERRSLLAPVPSSVLYAHPVSRSLSDPGRNPADPDVIAEQRLPMTGRLF